MPAGTRGNVIRMGNPKEGEFIVVRLGRDEVPFAPNELALSARGKTATTTAAKSAPAKKAARPAAAAARKSTRAKTTAAAKATPAKAAPAKSAPAKAAPAKPAATKAAPTRTTTRRAAKRSVRRGQHPLTVTLRYVDGQWTVEAQRGSRRLARASALRPGAVRAFAEHVDEQAVRDAISEIVESGRAVAAERAEKLRAELEAAEASLREYEARRR